MNFYSPLIPLGKIGKAFGIQGAVWVHLFNPNSETLRPSLQVTVRWPKKPTKSLTVEEVLPNQAVYFEEIADRNAAEALAGGEIWVNKTDLPVPLAHEVYLVDLLGYQVFDAQGQLLGNVTGISSNSLQPLLNIVHPDGPRGEVPFVPAFIIQVDAKNRQIYMNLPEGLLE